ncbi:hypothetical protein AMATHDRAFT_47693 [Amanita thiersii Skay4041]|uniref:Translation initiation factor eIF2B subunit epsilon n=1 Tax=Amanita thiersii Skay4041 TaxID=703135 RepID=A0A2A9NQY1_9AGAR|nr:hypothetical protein AMATHDRAFT_47693 [Amanita thiersii Skay4041]
MLQCLLPVCNASLLDWTFESLALAGVQEVFVVCRSHAEQIKTVIKGSKWSKPGSGMKIVPIVTAKETFSPGDAMRDIYTRGLVTKDFILVMGDLVSNIRLDEVVRVHKERRKQNKDAIMTIVVKECGVGHRTRPTGDSAVWFLDSKTSECLHYQPVTLYPPTRIVKLPRELQENHPEIDMRFDFIDCGIDICSVEVPSLFQDNFDYLDLRRDFVHGVLTSDLLMKNIYCYVAKEGYAARVKDTKSYDSVSKDILSRWTFPMVPDNNHPGGHSYEHLRGNKYFAKNHPVILARYLSLICCYICPITNKMPKKKSTCNVGTNTLIGSSTQILDGAEVHSSVIGQNCVIGPGAVIRESYIFDNTCIGSDCVIEQSIIGFDVTVKDNSHISKGCLIADLVTIGPNAKLEPFDRLSVRREAGVTGESDNKEEEEDSDIEEIEARQGSIKRNMGSDSNALIWPDGPLNEEEEEDEGPENFKNLRSLRIGDDVSDLDIFDDDSITSESENESSSEEDSELDTDQVSLTGGSESSVGDAAESEFQSEVKQSLERAFAEGHSLDNAAVELKTLRMASNVSLTRVREAVISAIVERIQLVEGGGLPQRQEITKVINRWGELIDRIGGIDPVETITLLQVHCATSERMPIFGQILAALYQIDVVDEDDIRTWHKLPESRAEDEKPGTTRENMKKCWIIVSHMIQQFNAQESESEEDDDTGGEEDEEEDE